MEKIEEKSCRCEEIHIKYKIPLNEEGHIQANTTQIERGPLKFLLNRNCRDKCIPNIKGFQKEMESKIKELIQNMNQTVNKIMHTTKLQSKISEIHIKQSHEHSDYAISKIEEHHDNLEQYGYATLQQIIKLKKELDPLILSECGKGKGILHLCCPI